MTIAIVDFMRLLDRWRRSGTVESPALQPVVFHQPSLVYPADVFELPVAVVSYFPAEGDRVPRRHTGDVEAPVVRLRADTMRMTADIVNALELGSIYHGYREPGAVPSLRYRIVERFEILEPLPTWGKAGHAAPMTDYAAIMERIEARTLVESQGVKEIWIWGYHGGVVDLWESNMAGPFGDVSNSDRDPSDLPVFATTYTVYHYNYGRGVSEAVEDHMHQIEAVLRHVDPHLFWDRFVGKVGEGRCGWAHYPPNGRHDYDWANPRRIATDIEDWQPEGGPRQPLNCDRWRGDSLTWFIYWMQNLPGRNNGLSFRGRPLTNWWTFIGDWDGAMRRNVGLHT